MAAITSTTSPTLPHHLRPFDPRRDLNAVADLIEACFNTTLDPDGRRYLRSMRAAARKKGLNRWTAMASGNVSLPLAGFVWDEDGRVVGNLSLIPFFSQGRQIYLIANVAVYAEYRRRGIARTLTEAALEKSRQRRVNDLWLHVRDDNDAALGLYTSMGFESQVQRTTWNINPGLLMDGATPGVRVTPRTSRHWKHQQLWLNQNYPLNLRWHFPLRIGAFQPGIFGFLHRFFNEVNIRHWAVKQGKDLLGLMSWQSSRGYADRLWLAAPPEQDDVVVLAVMDFLRGGGRVKRPLTLDYPAGRAVDALRAAGFQPQHTLIWMKSKSLW